MKQQSLFKPNLACMVLKVSNTKNFIDVDKLEFFSKCKVLKCVM